MGSLHVSGREISLFFNRAERPFCDIIRLVLGFPGLSREACTEDFSGLSISTGACDCLAVKPLNA